VGAWLTALLLLLLLLLLLCWYSAAAHLTVQISYCLGVF
jgi:hypothetical protein